MKKCILNISIDTDSPNGRVLFDKFCESKDGWLCASWIEREKYNLPELLIKSEAERMKAVEEAVRLNGECQKMAKWIKKVRDLMVFHDMHLEDCVFEKLIDEAPI